MYSRTNDKNSSLYLYFFSMVSRYMETKKDRGYLVAGVKVIFQTDNAFVLQGLDDEEFAILIFFGF